MAKHASTTPTVPRKVLLGAVLTVLLLGLLTARAVGAIGEDDPTPSAASTTPSSSPSDTAPSEEAPAEAAQDAAPGEVLTEGPSEPSEPEAKKDRPRADRNEEQQERRTQRTDESQKDLAAAVQDLLDEPAVGPTSFRVASFNVLGHSHTVQSGNKPQYAEGPTRMRMAIQILRNYDADIIGFQEFEPIQHAAFARTAGSQYAAYPGMKLGNKGVRRTIAWRTEMWEMVQASTITTRYFRGNRVPTPYVLLEHRKTGQRVWVINVHNPTSSAKRGNNARWRAVSKQAQAALVNRLHGQTDYPVILMGDFNERAEAFCTLTARAPLQASAGGANGPGCRPPGDLGIDWIFGTLDLDFTDHVRTRGGLISRASDHPIVVADAVVTPE